MAKNAGNSLLYIRGNPYDVEACPFWLTILFDSGQPRADGRQETKMQRGERGATTASDTGSRLPTLSHDGRVVTKYTLCSCYSKRTSD